MAAELSATGPKRSRHTPSPLSTSPSSPAARVAVLALFGLNGFLYASWAARIPDIQSRYGIDDGTMGLVLITASLGAFCAMPFAAYVNETVGVRLTSALSAMCYIVAVPLIPLFTSPLILFATYALLGVGFGLLDVAMNAQAVEVERAYRRSIMSSFHAGFSAAMIAGALVGSVVIRYEVSFAWHLFLAAAAAAAMLAYAYPRLPRESRRRPVAADAAEPAFRLPVRASWLIGAIGFCSMMSEASISDWITKYMLEVAGSVDYVAPWALAAFSVAMTLGRVVGDKLRDALSDRAILQWGSALALAGLAMSLAFPSPATTIAGATLVGTGLSVAVPIVFSLSGKLPGLSPSAALAMVTTISYLGLFLGPAVIGFLAEHFGLRVGYGFILAALALMLALSFRVRRRGSSGSGRGAPRQGTGRPRRRSRARAR